MDTNRLKRFATEARNILMQGVAHRFTALGFLPDGNVTEEPQPMGGGATFMGDTVSEDFYQKWCSLQQAVKRHSIEEVAEEAAYTWFNRIVAIRIMVKNGLISPVLQYESEGVHIPLLVSEARQGRMPEMNADDQRKLEDLLLDDSKTDEQFRILIVAFCHSNPVINSCFGHISDYTELLLPTNILAEGGFIDMLNNTEFISEEDYHSPELIGWLYQFYISEKKDDVFASFKKGKKAEAKDIPAATQIFTPNWIVKYMVQNTIGRIYLDNNPYETEIQKSWKYLVEPTTDSSNNKLTTDSSDLSEKNAIKSEESDKSVVCKFDDLKELKFADLASGSGHILNEGFDMLYDLYVLEGYSRSQAIENIFRYNLTGVDIDTRAKQLAQFALLLKACQKDSSFADAHIMPRVLDMPEPYPYKDNLRDTLPHFFLGGNQEMIQEVCDAIDLMDQSKNLGSIMKFNISERTRNAIMIRMEEYEKETHIPEAIRQLIPYMSVILALTEKYSALVMNPPYMGSGNMNESLSNYVKRNYEEGKTDLFSTFMLLAIDRLADKGKYGMINMHSWMFLSSFEKLRNSLLDNYHIDSLLHLGPRTFDELSGEVVQNAAFVVTKNYGLSDLSEKDESEKSEKSVVNKKSGVYFRLVDGKNCGDKERMFLDAQANHTAKVYYPNVEQKNFEKISGWPIGYWASDLILSIFENNPSLESYSSPRKGNSTSNNARFLRLWWEVEQNKMAIGYNSIPQLLAEGRRWVPYNKGGGTRKWYGYNENLIDWKDNAQEIREIPTSVVTNEVYYMKPGLTWSTIASGTFGVRFFEEGYIFDNGGCCLFDTADKRNYLASLLNSKVLDKFVEILSPTLNYQSGIISLLPICYQPSEDIDYNTWSCRNISKKDWDSHETSWDFEANPLVALRNEKVAQGNLDSSFRLSDFVEEFETQWTERFNQLHENEEELNHQFISIYGLEDELTPDVPLDEITILQQGEITIEECNDKELE